MWTKLEAAVSAECNEIVASKKFKERVQNPKETITLFVTDLVLLVKDCNYTDEDRQVRDQFVYGVSDHDLKKKLLEKGNTLTRIQAVSIGKFRNAVKNHMWVIVPKLYLKISQTKVLCVITVLTRKDHIASLTRDTAQPGEQCVTFARFKIILKILRNVSDSKKRENQSQSRSSKKPFVLKVDEDGEEHFYEVVDKMCALKQQSGH